MDNRLSEIQPTSAPAAVRLEDDDLLTDVEASKELRMSVAWFRLQRLKRSGPKVVRIGRRVFYRRGTLKQYARECES